MEKNLILKIIFYYQSTEVVLKFTAENPAFRKTSNISESIVTYCKENSENYSISFGLTIDDAWLFDIRIRDNYLIDADVKFSSDN